MTHETSASQVVPEAGRTAASGHRPRRNKVPEPTVYFWIIKVLCTTVGATAADLLNEKAGLGLTGVSVLMSALLAVVLAVQFRTSAYRAGVYWLTVAGGKGWSPRERHHQTHTRGGAPAPPPHGVAGGRARGLVGWVTR
ncbi:hypothetical protein ACFWPQ_16490, partial [Streptomyces sp. NPDC058464]